MAIPKWELQFGQIDHKLFSAPGSADIIEESIWTDAPPAWDGRPIEADASTIYDGRLEAVTTGTYYRERGEEDGLLVDKITEILHKEFGQMSLRVYITKPDIDYYYEIRVRYGAYQSCEVGISLPIHRYEAARDDFGFPLLIEGLAEELIWHIRKNIRNTMFGSEEEKPVEKVSAQGEKAFRKILI